jgi:hypothetical protein
MSVNYKYVPLTWRSPTKLQLFVYLAILILLGCGAFASALNFHARLGISVATTGANTPASVDYSAAMLWLIVANATSFLVVTLLAHDLHEAEKATRDLTFEIDEDAAQRLEIPQKTIERHRKKPLNLALAPLGRVYILSICVLLTIAVFGAIVWKGWPRIEDGLFTFLVVWTGLIYVIVMMCCDFAARESFRRLSCMRVRHHHEDSAETKAAEIKTFDELCEALGDFERMIRYVDYPFLAGAVMILFHKYVVLEPGSYYFGFLAGAIAMHTILANLVSLSIAISTGQTITPATNEGKKHG